MSGNKHYIYREAPELLAEAEAALTILTDEDEAMVQEIMAELEEEGREKEAALD